MIVLNGKGLGSNPTLFFSFFQVIFLSSGRRLPQKSEVLYVLECSNKNKTTKPQKKRNITAQGVTNVYKIAVLLMVQKSSVHQLREQVVEIPLFTRFYTNPNGSCLFLGFLVAINVVSNPRRSVD